MTAIFDPLAQREPYEAYRVLRAERPVHRDSARDHWVLSRFDDVQRAAREWQVFSSAEGVNLDDTLSLTGPGNLISSDPPAHERLRKVVRGRFTLTGIRAMEQRIRAGVQEDLRRVARDGAFDGAEIAWRLPVRTITGLLGLPTTDARMLGAWLRAVIAREPHADRLPASARAAGDHLRDYFLAQVAARRDAGERDDLLSDIVAAERRGELACEEITGLCILLFVAGTETVADFIGNALAVLAEHPDQRELLSADPERIPAGVEELLRFESPVQYQVRTATADAEFHGTTIHAGDPVVLLWGAANRDERRWERADALDVTREPKRNLAFGEGIHHCLGAPLARLQGRIVIEEMLALAPRYRVDGTIERIATHNTRGIAELPLVLA